MSQRLVPFLGDPAGRDETAVQEFLAASAEHARYSCVLVVAQQWGSNRGKAAISTGSPPSAGTEPSAGTKPTAEKKPSAGTEPPAETESCAVTKSSAASSAVVASAAAAPPTSGRLLSDAIRFAQAEWEGRKCDRFSIVVHEGIYVDELYLFEARPPPEQFVLEIVGVGDKKVEIVFENQSPIIPHGVDLALKNLVVKDRRPDLAGRECFMNYSFVVGGVFRRPGDSHRGGLGISGKARVDFEDVEIVAPSAVAIRAGGVGARVRLFRCRLLGALIGFECDHGAEFHVSDSLLKDHTRFCGLVTDTRLRASRTTFYGSVTMSQKDDAVFDDCVFRGDWNPDADPMYQLQRRGSAAAETFASSTSPADVFQQFVSQMDPGSLMRSRYAVGVTGGGSVSLLNSTVSDYWSTVLAMQAGSNFVVRGCNIKNNRCAFSSMYNIDARIEDNEIRAEILLEMEYNAEGKVVFKRNKMHKNKPPKLSYDAVSENALSHDFGGRYLYAEIEKTDIQPSLLSARSEFTRETNREVTNANRTYDEMMSLLVNPLYKRCALCNAFEGDKILDREGRVVREVNKLKHCSGCQKVCYCSRKCQKDDWRDHKVRCSPPATQNCGGDGHWIDPAID